MAIGTQINKSVPISSLALSATPQPHWQVPVIGWDAVAQIYRPYKVTIASMGSALVNKLGNGPGAPQASDGVDGDFWINTATSPYTIYGPKAAGVWPAGQPISTTIRSGTGVPGGGVGNNGDFYYDLTASPIRFYGPKTAGAWGTGIATSNVLRSGSGVPSVGLGNDGDFYLDVSTVPYNIYGPKAAGAWGAAVPTALTVRSGSGVPSNALGNNGDFYINTATNNIHGPKAANVWPSGVSLVGPSGANGAVWYSGGTPSNGTGTNGDYYVQTTGSPLGEVYTKVVGVWVSTGNIRGATGSGDVTGPGSAVSGAPVVFSGTTGKVMADAALGNWKMLFLGTAGALTALSLGADKTIFASNGASSAPGMRTAANLGLLETGVTATITKGFTVTPNALGTMGSFTLDPTLGNYQYGTNNGAFTLTAPTSDCAVDVLVTNGASAGTITFSGFTVAAGNTGDALTTTNTSKFLLSIRRINSISTYIIKALQ